MKHQWKDKEYREQQVLKIVRIVAGGMLALYLLLGLAVVKSETATLVSKLICSTTSLVCLFALYQLVPKPPTAEETRPSVPPDPPATNTISRRGYVYIVTDGSHYKIGITSGDVSRRLAQLQTGNPRRLRIVKVIGSDDPARTEHTLHVMLQHRRGHGEWFKLSPSELEILKRIE